MSNGATQLRKTSERGYGSDHQRERRRRLDLFHDGDPCARCGKPMRVGDPIDLDHRDDDRTQYLGLSHRACNRRANPGCFKQTEIRECAICGAPRSRRSVTCGRACGWEYRRRNAGD